MGLFFKKRKGKMEIPPPPPPGEGEPTQEKEQKEMAAEAAKPKEADEHAMPETHLPSEIPEIHPGRKQAQGAGAMPRMPPMQKMPEFPEVPEEAEEGMEKRAMPHPHAAPGPLKAGQKFVSISNFQTVLTKSDEIRGSLKEAETMISRLNELRNEEEKEFQKWRSQLEGVEKKLNYVDQVIFKGE